MTFKYRRVERVICITFVLKHNDNDVIPDVPLPVEMLPILFPKRQHRTHMEHNLMSTELIINRIFSSHIIYN